MKPPDSILTLIAKEFSHGFILDEDIIHFSRSTLGMNREDLVAAICSGDPHGTGLLDLIIVPNNEIRRVLEKYIPPDGIDKENLGELADKAHALIKSAGISIKGDSVEIRIDLTPGLVDGYINKLMLTKEVPCKKSLPASGIDNSFNLDILVHLRRSGRELLNRDAIDICWVVKALRDSGTSAAETIEAIDLISDAIKKYHHETDLLFMVTAEKSFWLQMMERKKFVEDAVEKYSMELVMMQKINPGVFNLQDIERRINTADLLLNLLYQDNR